MATPKDYRSELKTIISAAMPKVRFSTYLPPQINPDIAIIMPDASYIVPAETFGYHTISFKILIITKQATNEAETDKLDEILTQIVLNLQAQNWQLTDEGVEEPAIRTLGEFSYLSTQLHVKADILLTNE